MSSSFNAGRLFSDSGALQILDGSGGVPATAVAVKGWAVSPGGYVYVNNLEASAVPAGARFLNGIAFANDGCMYVTTDTPSGAVSRNGMAVRADGALHIAPGNADTDQVIAGWAVTSTGQARVFDPIPAFSGLHMWDSRRTDLITIGTGVSSLAAVTSGTPALVQGTGASQPALSTLNGVQALSFDGTDDWMETATNLDLSGTKAITVFYLMSMVADGVTAQVLSEQTSGTSDDSVFADYTTPPIQNLLNTYAGPAPSNGSQTDASFVDNTAFIYSSGYDRALGAGKTGTPWLNLNSASTQNGVGNNDTAMLNAKVYLGAGIGPVFPTQMKVVIYAIAPRLVSDFERTMMVRWLASQGQVSV